MHLAKDGKGQPYLINGNGQRSGLGATTLKKKLAAIRKFASFLVAAGYHDVTISAGIMSPGTPTRSPPSPINKSTKPSCLKPNDGIISTTTRC